MPDRCPIKVLPVELAAFRLVVLKLFDVPSEYPVAHHKQVVDRSGGAELHLPMRALTQLDEKGEIELSTHRDSPIFSRCPSTFSLSAATSSPNIGRGLA